MARMTLTIEPVRAFNGLDVLVARDEGFFAEEGLELRMTAAQPQGTGRNAAAATLTQPLTAQGRQQERGTAAMFQG